MAITCGPHMLHTTPAMPGRTSQTGGQAILASSQHSTWHHQSKFSTESTGIRALSQNKYRQFSPVLAPEISELTI